MQGKIALVTGGDSGIGRSVGVHFALEGATVAFTYVAGLEDKDAEDTIKLLKDSKTSGAQDPLKIPTDLGFDENCKKVSPALFSLFCFTSLSLSLSLSLSVCAPYGICEPIPHYGFPCL